MKNHMIFSHVETIHMIFRHHVENHMILEDA
ncbi:hypothetical protein J2749_001105 [Methanobacterium oryzae]